MEQKRRCVGTVGSGYRSLDRRACNKAALTGQLTCNGHRMPSPRKYYIGIKRKGGWNPKTGRHHKWAIAKLFDSRETAQTYLDYYWGEIARQRTGQARLVSACIESIYLREDSHGATKPA